MLYDLSVCVDFPVRSIEAGVTTGKPCPSMSVCIIVLAASLRLIVI
jgi:hypothetical protein